MTRTYPNSGPVTLRVNLGDYPGTRALKAGEIRSELVKFDFCGPRAPHEGFKPMVRELAYDAGELAIVTFLQAKAFGKQLVLLPAPILSRTPHHSLFYNASAGPMEPKDIEGKRFGTRSYTVTTGVWMRGILRDDYGVETARATWCAASGGHLSEYRDPANVEHLPAGANIEQMLVDGQIDGAILAGPAPKEPFIRALIANPDEAAHEWVDRHRFVPVNHLFVVDRLLFETRPDVVAELYRILKDSKEVSTHGAGIDPTPFGVEANRARLDLIARYAFEQAVVPRKFAVDELFEPGIATLA